MRSAPLIGQYAALESPPPVLYRGIGHAVEDSNILAVRVLRGNPSTYSANPTKPIEGYPENAGQDTLLVTALQARNNARLLVTGSLDMFSNSFYRAKVSGDSSPDQIAGNEVFCGELSKWVFGDSGVLRFRDIVHHKVLRLLLACISCICMKHI
jgi:Oligosaccharyltransferase 48 kDa subunit beta